MRGTSSSTRCSTSWISSGRRSSLVENVEGFARRFVSKPGETSSSPAEQVVQALSSLGYRAGYFVVGSSRFGVPQLRRRGT